MGSEGLGSSPPTPKKYGVTKPISKARPSEVDINRSRELEKFLVDSGLYDNQEEAAKREEVMGRIGLPNGGVGMVLGILGVVDSGAHQKPLISRMSLTSTAWGIGNEVDYFFCSCGGAKKTES